VKLPVNHSEYRDSQNLSRSDLRTIANSPALYHAMQRGEVERRAPSAAMQFGTMLDELVTGGIMPQLPPHKLIPDALLSRSGTKGTDAARQFIADNPSVRCVTRSEQDAMHKEHAELTTRLNRCLDSLASHKYAHALLTDSDRKYQFPLYWTDNATCVGVKSLPDLVIPGKCILDLKTTADTSPRAFMNSSYKFWYDVQAFMFQEGWRVIYGTHLPVVFVLVRNEEPYNCEVYEVDNDYTMHGGLRYTSALQTYVRCDENNEWVSDTHDQIVKVQTPSWWERAFFNERSGL